MLKPTIYSQILHDNQLQGKLMIEANLQFSTLTRWARTKSDRLEKVQIVKLISEYMKLESDELFVFDTQNSINQLN